MKGYQRAGRGGQADRLADIARKPRNPRSPPADVHIDRGDGDSYCGPGRRSYLITADPAKGTCKKCQEMAKEEKS